MNAKRNWPLIKACGIKTSLEASIALANGANAIGLVVTQNPNIAHRDEIGTDTACIICRMVHANFPQARVVLVTHCKDYKIVVQMANTIGVDSIQIHDDMSMQEVKSLHAQLPACELFKVVPVAESVENATQAAIEYAKPYTPYVDGFMTDLKAGRAFVKAFPEKPVVITGDAQNAEEVVFGMRPSGIDANTGLKNPDGSVNPMQVRQFAAMGKQCKPVGQKHARKSQSR